MDEKIPIDCTAGYLQKSVRSFFLSPIRTTSVSSALSSWCVWRERRDGDHTNGPADMGCYGGHVHRQRWGSGEELVAMLEWDRNRGSSVYRTLSVKYTTLAASWRRRGCCYRCSYSWLWGSYRCVSKKESNIKVNEYCYFTNVWLKRLGTVVGMLTYKTMKIYKWHRNVKKILFFIWLCEIDASFFSLSIYTTNVYIYKRFFFRNTRKGWFFALGWNSMCFVKLIPALVLSF